MGGREMAAIQLIVIDTPPYGDWRGREALDMALSLAAFDRPVALLFRGEGVNWLRPGQDGAALSQKTVSRNLGAARMFGVAELFADSDALARFAIERPDPEVKAVTPDAGFYGDFSQVVQL
ncbi:DsrE family protein [Marinobacter lacisalsi]|uniref:DsrE family protein n=1 Tax=Marinobacter lacisalsi TaxID=475979 RepID=A0ABV8QJH5_9GAMM